VSEVLAAALVVKWKATFPFRTFESLAETLSDNRVWAETFLWQLSTTPDADYPRAD
jgi:hypothetical protein